MKSEKSSDYPYELYDGALKAKENRLSNSIIRDKVVTDFSKLRGRDNSFYRINEGNNLDQELNHT
jgi:hypothetical protein